MKKSLLALGIAAVLGVNIAGTSAVGAADKVEITNVSYDPTRELYEQYNADKKFDGDEEKIKDFIKKLYANVLVLDSVAIVDSVVDKKGTREVATEYLNYLYSDEAQRIAGDNYYRPSNEDILKEYADVFDLNVNLVTIDDFGGWEKAQETHFADGGVFDQIYEE